jgi:predicted chitinase
MAIAGSASSSGAFEIGSIIAGSGIDLSGYYRDRAALIRDAVKLSDELAAQLSKGVSGGFKQASAGGGAFRDLEINATRSATRIHDEIRDKTRNAVDPRGVFQALDRETPAHGLTIGRNLEGAIARGVAMGNLLAGAIQGAAKFGIDQVLGSLPGQISQLVGGTLNGGGQLQSAVSIQLQQITGATNIAALTGKSIQEAQTLIQTTEDALAVSAAALPGNTEDFKQLARSINDDLIGAFKNLDGQLDTGRYQKSLISISESFGALTASSTRDIGNTQLALSKALSGASVSELRQLAFFEQNANVRSALEKAIAEAGIKSLRDLTIEGRVKLLESIGAQFVDENFKGLAGDSVDGLLQSFRSKLFDPSTGIFGIMKDLEPATDGIQSVFTSFNKVLSGLISENSEDMGLIFRIFESAQDAGLKLGTPMMLQKRILDGLAESIDRAKGGVDEFFQSPAAQGLIEIANTVRSVIVSLVDAGGEFLSNFLPGLGKGFSGLNHWLEGVGSLLDAIAEKIGPIAKAVGEFAGKTAGAVFEFGAGNLGRASEFVQNAGGQAVDFVRNATSGGVDTSGAEEAGAGVASFFGGMVEQARARGPEIAAALAESLGQAASSGIDLAGGLLGFSPEQIEGVKERVVSVMQAIGGVIEPVVSLVGSGINVARSFLESTLPLVPQLLGGVGGLIEGIAGGVERIFNGLAAWGDENRAEIQDNLGFVFEKIGSLGDFIENKIAPGVLSVLTYVGEVFGNITDWFQENESAIGTLIESTASGLGRVGEFLGKAFDLVGLIAAGAGDLLLKIGNNGGFQAGLETVLGLATKILDILIYWASESENVQAALLMMGAILGGPMLVTPLGLIVASIASIGSMLQTWPQLWKATVDITTAYWNILKINVTESMKNLGDRVVKVGEDWKNKINTSVENTVKRLNESNGWIGKIWQGTKNLETPFKKVADFTKNIFENLGKAFPELKKLIDMANGLLGRGGNSGQGGTIDVNAAHKAGDTKSIESAIVQYAMSQGITDKSQLAYILATARHESGNYKYTKEIGSNERFTQLYEGRVDDLGNTQRGDGVKFAGRGYVQLTGRRNYEVMGKKLGLDLVNNPELAELPENAVKIMIQGMREGIYTGRKLSDFGKGGNFNAVAARQIVNGTDKDAHIAGIYRDVMGSIDSTIEAAKVQPSEGPGFELPGGNGGKVIGISGNTGVGTGAHIHIQRADRKEPTAEDIAQFEVDGKPLSSFPRTSGYGPRWGRTHYGIDFGVPEGSKVTMAKNSNKVDLVENVAAGGAAGNITAVDFADGNSLELLHMSDATLKIGKFKPGGGKLGPASPFQGPPDPTAAQLASVKQPIKPADEKLLNELRSLLLSKKAREEFSPERLKAGQDLASRATETAEKAGNLGGGLRNEIGAFMKSGGPKVKINADDQKALEEFRKILFEQHAYISEPLRARGVQIGKEMEATLKKAGNLGAKNRAKILSTLDEIEAGNKGLAPTLKGARSAVDSARTTAKGGSGAGAGASGAGESGADAASADGVAFDAANFINVSETAKRALEEAQRLNKRTSEVRNQARKDDDRRIADDRKLRDADLAIRKSELESSDTIGAQLIDQEGQRNSLADERASALLGVDRQIEDLKSAQEIKKKQIEEVAALRKSLAEAEAKGTTPETSEQVVKEKEQAITAVDYAAAIAELEEARKRTIEILDKKQAPLLNNAAKALKEFVKGAKESVETIRQFNIAQGDRSQSTQFEEQITAITLQFEKQDKSAKNLIHNLEQVVATTEKGTETHDQAAEQLAILREEYEKLAGSQATAIARTKEEQAMILERQRLQARDTVMGLGVDQAQPLIGARENEAKAMERFDKFGAAAIRKENAEVQIRIQLEQRKNQLQSQALELRNKLAEAERTGNKALLDELGRAGLGTVEGINSFYGAQAQAAEADAAFDVSRLSEQFPTAFEAFRNGIRDSFQQGLSNGLQSIVDGGEFKPLEMLKNMFMGIFKDVTSRGIAHISDKITGGLFGNGEKKGLLGGIFGGGEEEDPAKALPAAGASAGQSLAAGGASAAQQIMTAAQTWAAIAGAGAPGAGVIPGAVPGAAGASPLGGALAATFGAIPGMAGGGVLSAVGSLASAFNIPNPNAANPTDALFPGGTATFVEGGMTLAESFKEGAAGFGEKEGQGFGGALSGLLGAFGGGGAKGGGGIGNILSAGLSIFKSLGIFAEGGPAAPNFSGSMAAALKREGPKGFPAVLNTDEFVIRGSAHQKYGTDFLSRINSGSIPVPNYEMGGAASRTFERSFGGDVSTPQTLAAATQNAVQRHTVQHEVRYLEGGGQKLVTADQLDRVVKAMGARTIEASNRSMERNLRGSESLRSSIGL